MKHTRLGMRAAAGVAVVGLLAGACGGSEDDGEATSPDDGAEVVESERDAPEALGGNDGATAPAEEPAPEPLEEGNGAVAAEALDAEAPVAEPAPTAQPGGLFAEEGRETEDAVEPREPTDTTFEDYGIRDFVDADVDPLSTFALDVDTGSFTVARRYLEEGLVPPRESVRVEEYVNAFDYDYDDPDGDALGITVEGGPSPFDDANHIVRIGIQSQRLDDEDRPSAALTFVIDTSGSMETGGRLELVKEALEELVEELDAGDTVAIVEFDDRPSVVLQPTRADDPETILRAVDRLEPGGSTNVEEGLALGYELADEGFDSERVNRVILLSDGVANAGLTDPDGLAGMIRRDADRGINLLTVGVGFGNYNDVLLEQLADQGDGFYAYVDTDDEAERLFEDELTATLVTLAIDAKIQVAFDADIVERYRLIGFENRGVLDSDFRDDDVDAGEIGAGHQVTAVYEIELRERIDLDDTDELGEVRLRWQEPGGGDVVEIDEDIEMNVIEDLWSDTSASFKLAVVVAGFAEVLRDSPFAAGIELDALEEEAEILADATGSRDVEELADMIDRADRLR